MLTLEEAEKTLERCSEPVWYGRICEIRGEKRMGVDGYFTLEELEALLVIFREELLGRD